MAAPSGPHTESGRGDRAQGPAAGLPGHCIESRGGPGGQDGSGQQSAGRSLWESLLVPQGKRHTNAVRGEEIPNLTSPPPHLTAQTWEKLAGGCTELGRS